MYRAWRMAHYRISGGDRRHLSPDREHRLDLAANAPRPQVLADLSVGNEAVFRRPEIQQLGTLAGLRLRARPSVVLETGAAMPQLAVTMSDGPGCPIPRTESVPGIRPASRPGYPHTPYIPRSR